MPKIRTLEQNPRGAGRKPLPESERRVKTSVSLHPTTKEFLLAQGEGVLSNGIEAVVAEFRRRGRRAAKA